MANEPLDAIDVKNALVNALATFGEFQKVPIEIWIDSEPYKIADVISDNRGRTIIADAEAT